MQGKFAYFAGASGTVTLPNGATVKRISAHASGAATITIFGGASIPLVSGMTLSLGFVHDNCVAGQTSGGGVTIVFTGTDSYYVETIGSAY